MGPLDYSIDVQSPFQSALQGFQAGNTMASMQAERQKQELANQAAQAAAERQKLVQQETAALFSNPNPTAKDFVRVASMLPEKEAASMRENWNTLKKESQDHSLQFAGQTMAAFNSGSPEVGISLLKEKAAAERNSGNEAQAKAYETWAQLAEKNPQAVMKSIGMMVAQVPGGDKVIESVTKIGAEKRAEDLAPAILTEQQAKAKSASVAAQFAESNAVKDLEKKGWDITKIQEDIKINKENARIAALNAAISREGNQLKRQEMGLKLQEIKDKRDEVVREKVAEATESVNAVDTTRTLIQTIKGDEDSLRAATGASAWRAWIPGTKARTSAGQLEQLSNSIAASKLALLKGATSDKDIAFLKSIDSNLDRFQNEDALVKEVNRIDRGMFELRERLVKKSGMPDIKPSASNKAASETKPEGLTTDDILKELGAM